MLTELCGYLKNWFEVGRYYSDFVIADNNITFADGSALPLQDGQYFRIIGSIFNDGVHCYHVTSGESPTSSEVPLKDESFDGTVCAMRVPNEIIVDIPNIMAWRAKNEAIDSPAMSPFNSESGLGYSYSKSNDGIANGANGWLSVYGKKYARYRKA